MRRKIITIGIICIIIAMIIEIWLELLQFNYGNTVIIFDKYKKTFVTC